jgi:capsid protein
LARKASSLSALRNEAESVRLQLEIAKGKKAVQFFNKYESLDAADTTRKRKRIHPEVKAPDALQTGRERLIGVARGRDLMENSPTFKTLMRSFEHGAIRTGPKIQVNADPEGTGKTATEWFNGVWAKGCDGRDDMHFGEFVALACTAEKMEGDALFVFDDFKNDDGTLLVFSGDQLVGIDDFDKRKPEFWPGAASCDKGVIIDPIGRVLGYAVTSEYGKERVPLSDPHLMTVAAWHPVRNPTGSAKLYKRPWRFNQRRGQADAWTIANTQQDIKEMADAELQSAKLSAQIFAYIESDPTAAPAIERAMAAAGLPADQIESILYGDGSQTGALAKNYKALEAACGGVVEYLNGGEKANIHTNERPSGNVSSFGEWAQILSGAAMGIGRARATGKAEASYTAFKGEENITWETFEVEQKRLERRLVDFIVFKALTWGQDKGRIARLPAGWEMTVTVDWPVQKDVDAYKSSQAIRHNLKNGQTTFAEVLGPNWEKHLRQLGKELEVARALKLPLSIFGSAAGGPPTTLILDPNTDTNAEPAQTQEE